MANTRNSTSGNRFLVEIDGIPAFKATKVSIGEDKHEPVKTRVGNNPNALLSRGNIDQSETTITIPIGSNDNSLRALQAWKNGYFNGANAEPKTARVITYDETGRTPIQTEELLDCVPISLKLDDKGGDDSNTATMTLTIMASETRMV